MNPLSQDKYLRSTCIRHQANPTQTRSDAPETPKAQPECSSPSSARRRKPYEVNETSTENWTT